MKTRSLLLIGLLLVSFNFAVAQAEDEKVALYTKFTQNIKGDEAAQKTAYEQGKEYITKYGNDNDQYVTYVKGWLAKYEKVLRNSEFQNAFVAKNYTKTFELGRQILTEDGDSFPVLVRLVEAGAQSARSGNSSLNNDTVTYAKKALELLDAGKVTDPAPYKNVNDVRDFLNFNIGIMTLEKSPAEAATVLKKVAASSGIYKTEPSTYAALANAISVAEYEPLAKEYAPFVGKEETPESKALYTKIKGVADRIIDAYARAVALSTKPEQQEFKKSVMGELTTLYKQFNNNSDAGLNELIAGVLAKPLP